MLPATKSSHGFGLREFRPGIAYEAAQHSQVTPFRGEAPMALMGVGHGAIPAPANVQTSTANLGRTVRPRPRGSRRPRVRCRRCSRSRRSRRRWSRKRTSAPGSPRIPWLAGGPRRAFRPTKTIRPSVKVRYSLMTCGGVSQPAAWSLGTTNFRQVSASVSNAEAPPAGRCRPTRSGRSRSPPRQGSMRPAVVADLRDAGPRWAASAARPPFAAGASLARGLARPSSCAPPSGPVHPPSKGSNSSTPNSRKSRTFLVATVNRCTLAVAALMASSIRVSDLRCLRRAHSRKATASIGRTP